MSKSVNVDFVTRQIEVDTDGKEYYVSAAVAAKDAEQSMINAQNAAKEVKEIYGDGNFTPLSDLLGGLGTKLKRWGSIFANKVFASNLPIVYNNVAEMKADTMLWEGMNTKTLGYYEPNDGGGAYYLIRAKADSDTVDNGSLHDLANGLVAEMIVENGTVRPEQFGAKGDGVSDDRLALLNAVKTLYKINLTKTYLLKDGFYFDSLDSLYLFGGGTIHLSANDYGIEHKSIFRILNINYAIVDGVSFVYDVENMNNGAYDYYYHLSFLSVKKYVKVIYCNFYDHKGHIITNDNVKPFYGVVHAGVEGMECHEVHIESNNIYNGCGRTIYCTFCDNVVVSKNNIDCTEYNNNYNSESMNQFVRILACKKALVTNNNIQCKITTTVPSYVFGAGAAENKDICNIIISDNVIKLDGLIYTVRVGATVCIFSNNYIVTNNNSADVFKSDRTDNYAYKLFVHGNRFVANRGSILMVSHWTDGCDFVFTNNVIDNNGNIGYLYCPNENAKNNMVLFNNIMNGTDRQGALVGLNNDYTDNALKVTKNSDGYITDIKLWYKGV